MPDRHLKIIIIEDTQTDADLLIRRLRKYNFKFDYHQVQNAKELKEVLVQENIDVVISDFNLPAFDGTEALQIVRDHDPMIPFILLSGTINQEQETEILQLGADEVIMKSNLNRLHFAVRRVLYENENKKQLKLLESVVTNTNDAVIILEAESNDLPGRKIVYVNDALTKMTGYSKEEIIGRTTNVFNGPETDKKKLRELGEAMDRWESHEVEIINYKKCGTEFWVNVSVIPVADSKGGHSHWICIEREITDRIKREQEIRESLNEKEVLLAEVHHRVKNNLAVVSGFLQLERFQSESPAIQDILRKAELRIKSIATIHENLYNTDNFAAIESAHYIDDIINSIQDSFESKFKNISLEKNIEDFSLNVNQAIPFGLIINELLSNIYKHAFKGRKSGQITIEVTEKYDIITLVIADNGVGLPENINYKEGGNLGFTIVKTLVSQLKGTDNILDDDGFTFQLKFRKSDKKGSASAIHLKGPARES